MQFLWFAIVLALIQCYNGQDESVTVSEDLINSIFSNDATLENKYGAETSTIPQDIVDALFNTNDHEPSEKEMETETTENPIQTPKAPNVSMISHRLPFVTSNHSNIRFFSAALQSWRMYSILPLHER